MAIVLSFLARITVFFTNAIVAIAANAMLRGIILSVAVLIAAAFLIVAVIGFRGVSIERCGAARGFASSGLSPGR